MPSRARYGITRSCNIRSPLAQVLNENRPASLPRARPPTWQAATKPLQQSCEDSAIRLVAREVRSAAGLLRRVQRLLDRGDHLALHGKRPARNARAGRGGMAAAAELRGDFVDVHLLAF